MHAGAEYASPFGRMSVETLSDLKEGKAVASSYTASPRDRIGEETYYHWGHKAFKDSGFKAGPYTRLSLALTPPNVTHTRHSLPTVPLSEILAAGAQFYVIFSIQLG
jgi:hypothetical protein